MPYTCVHSPFQLPTPISLAWPFIRGDPMSAPEKQDRTFTATDFDRRWLLELQAPRGADPVRLCCASSPESVWLRGFFLPRSTLFTSKSDANHFLAFFRPCHQFFHVAPTHLRYERLRRNAPSFHAGSAGRNRCLRTGNRAQQFLRIVVRMRRNKPGHAAQYPIAEQKDPDRGFARKRDGQPQAVVSPLAAKW